jgi:hypothetical protein
MSEETKVLTKAVAEKYIKDDSVDLDEFTEIEDDAAEILSKCEWDLFLGGLTAFSDAAAESFSKHKGGVLYLDGLTALSDAAAESLCKHEGEVRLSERLAKEFLTKEVAEKFIKGELVHPESGCLIPDLSGFTKITDDAAEILSKFEGDLFLRGLTSLSDAAAESLSKHKGGLTLNGLTALSNAAAESLAKHPNLVVNEDLEAVIGKYQK